MSVSTDRSPIDTVLADHATAWDAGDAGAYANLFTPDATYVVFDGTVLRGAQAIEDVHRRLFDGPLRNSRLGGANSGPPAEVRFLRPDVAVALVAGAVRPEGVGMPAPDRESVVSLVLADTAEGWRIAAFHNTRVQERGR